MPFGLGFFATAGVSAAAGSFDLLESQVLTSGQSSVTFSSINANYGATYKHLQLRSVARDDRSGGTGSVLYMRINGDTGSNYFEQSLYGDGSNTGAGGSGSQTVLVLGDITGAAGTTDAYTPVITDFLDPFVTTKTKAIRSFAGQATNYNWLVLHGGARNNTEVVNSITLFGIGANLVAGSRFSLYGIKG